MSGRWLQGPGALAPPHLPKWVPLQLTPLPVAVAASNKVIALGELWELEIGQNLRNGGVLRI